jgi:hypothetical protein
MTVRSARSLKRSGADFRWQLTRGEQEVSAARRQPAALGWRGRAACRYLATRPFLPFAVVLAALERSRAAAVASFRLPRPPLSGRVDPSSVPRGVTRCARIL